MLSHLFSRAFRPEQPCSGIAGNQRERGLRLFLFAPCLALFILWLAGCACAGKVQEASAKEGDALTEADPSGLGLSREAEHFYYYLLLSDALNAEDNVLIAKALHGLLSYEPSLTLFQDNAAIQLSRGDFTSAIALASQGLASYPDDPMLTMLLAGGHNGNGNKAESFRLLEEHLKKFPASKDVRQELIRFHLMAGNNEKAAALLAGLPEAGNTPAQDIFRAKVLAATGKEQESEALLKKLTTADPGFFEAWFDLAVVMERQKKLDQAATAFMRAAELSPQDAELWFRAASIHLELKAPEKALAAIHSAPGSPMLLLQAALSFFDAGYYAESDALLSEAEANGASPVETALYRSLVRQKLTGDPLAAAAPLAAVPQDHPLYGNAMLRLVQLYIEGGEFKKAHTTAAKARKLLPERVEFSVLEALALARDGKREKGEQILRDALKSQPENEDLLYALGSMQEQRGDRDGAVRTMERIVSLNPKSARALNYIGYHLADSDMELDRALSLITTALEIKPDADYIVDSLAWVQYRLKRFEEAWATIQRCLSLGADDPAIWEHYAEIALALDKKEEAAKGFTEALRHAPKNADELKRKLESVRKKQ